MQHYSFDIGTISLIGVEAAGRFFEPIFFDRDRELLIIALCDDDVGLLELLTYPGSAVEVVISFRALLRRAVTSGCAGLFAAHNHPSGDTRPSAGDIRFTRRLSLAAEATDIPLIDHLVFGEGPPFSFRSAGMI